MGTNACGIAHQVYCHAVDAFNYKKWPEVAHYKVHSSSGVYGDKHNNFIAADHTDAAPHIVVDLKNSDGQDSATLSVICGNSSFKINVFSEAMLQGVSVEEYTNNLRQWLRNSVASALISGQLARIHHR